jgi:hypothetical protein
VNCQEFQEHISAAVDDCLGIELRGSFESHRGECASCRQEFEAEAMVKSLIGVRASRVSAPKELAYRIAHALRLNEPPMYEEHVSWWRSLVASAFFRPAVAFGAACLIVMLIVHPPSTNPPTFSTASLIPGDVIAQSLANYRDLLSGRITPERVEKPEHLKSFFAGLTEFAVVVPEMKGCSLVGAVRGQHAGTNLAHVVYDHNGKRIYVYEACWKTVQEGKKLRVPDNVRAALDRTGWYSDSAPDGGAIVLWTKGATLCVVVATMKREELLAFVTSNESSPGDNW